MVGESMARLSFSHSVLSLLPSSFCFMTPSPLFLFLPFSLSLSFSLISCSFFLSRKRARDLGCKCRPQLTPGWSADEIIVSLRRLVWPHSREERRSREWRIPGSIGGLHAWVQEERQQEGEEEEERLEMKSKERRTRMNGQEARGARGKERERDSPSHRVHARRQATSCPHASSSCTCFHSKIPSHLHSRNILTRTLFPHQVLRSCADLLRPKPRLRQSERAIEGQERLEREREGKAVAEMPMTTTTR